MTKQTKLLRICDVYRSDETNSDVISPDTEETGCPEESFLCTGKAKVCVGKSLICDGKADCPNSEDEQGCPDESKQGGFLKFDQKRRF